MSYRCRMADDPLTTQFITGTSSESGAVRLRAPRQQGNVKKQVSVSDVMWGQLTAAAKEIGATPNDLLVRLAARGLHDAQQARETARVAEDRWQAFSAAESRSASRTGALSEDELIDAAHAFGRD